MSALLYPSIAEPTAEDVKIWKQLNDLVEQRQDGANNATAKATLKTFLKLEKEKRNYVDQNENQKTPKDIRIVPQSTTPAVAPFVVPGRINFDIGPRNGAYYNFALKKVMFNGKVKSDNGEETTFDKNTVTLLTGNGNYESTYDNVKIAKLQKTERRTGQRVPIFTLDSAGDVVIKRSQIKNIVPDEVLKKYVQYRILVDEVFELDPEENHYDSRMADAMNKLGALFQDARLSINGTAWRRAHLNLSAKETLEKSALEKKREEWADRFNKFRGEYSNTIAYDKDELVEFKGKLYKSFIKNNKGGLVGGQRLSTARWIPWKTGMMTQTQRDYDLNEIDKVRMELDARLWSKFDRHAMEHKRDEPTLYDLFEILDVDKKFPLETALSDAVDTLLKRKSETPYPWESRGYVYYKGAGEPVSKFSIEESALVNCLRTGSSSIDQPQLNVAAAHIQSLRNAIVKHMFRFPSLGGLGGARDPNNVLALPFSKLHDKKIVSGTGQIESDFVNMIRYGSDSEAYVSLMKTPWPLTKRFLLKVDTRSRYYPEQYRDARLPDVFYLNLKKEHEACFTLRKISYALELSNEKGYPVIEKKRVVTPEAYGTDYHSMRLPRVMASKSEAGEQYLDWEPNSFRERGRKRSYDGGLIKVRTLNSHPLYPSKEKVQALESIRQSFLSP